MRNSGNILSALCLLLGTLTVSASGNAGLITIYGDYNPGPSGPDSYYDATVARGTLECSISCEGQISSWPSGTYSAEVPPLSSADGWSPTSADVFYLENNAIATELGIINTFSSQVFESATQTDTGGASTYSFSSIAEVLLFKIGASPDMFIIRNTSGQEQTYSYTGFAGLGSGLSHYTTASVPEPGSISLMAAGLILLGLMQLRKRRPVGTA